MQTGVHVRGIRLAARRGRPPQRDWSATAVPTPGGGGAVVVLDSDSPAGDDGCVHGVPWFTARLGGALTGLCASRGELTLAEILAEAIRRTRGRPPVNL